MIEHNVYWYVRVDDAARAPDATPMSSAEWSRRQSETRAIFRARPACAILREFPDAGTIRVTIPQDQLESLGRVDAAFLSAGLMRDPSSPEQASDAHRLYRAAAGPGCGRGAP